MRQCAWHVASSLSARRVAEGGCDCSRDDPLDDEEQVWRLQG